MLQEEAPPEISVVLCTYNGEKFLEEQLQSILNQSILPREIEVSDDGSSDHTMDIVHRVSAASDPSIRWTIVQRQEPLGPAANFAAALTQANYDLIALSDQDDVWESSKLEILVAALENSADASLVFSDATIISDTGGTSGSLMNTLRLTPGEFRAISSGAALDALMRRNLVTGATLMLRKSLLDSALPIPHGWVHDEWLALVSALQHGVIFEPLRLTRYRQHQSNQIGAVKTDSAEARRRLREPWGAFHQKKALRNQGIAELLDSAPSWLSGEAAGTLRGKLEHDAWRASLPISRSKRVLPVMGRFFRGHYSRYARGILDVIRDISLVNEPD